MSLSARTSLALAALAFVAACAPQTGLLIEVQGPGAQSAGIVELRLLVAHASYCERWITDQQASALTVSVAGRDLDNEPVKILLTPDSHTGGILHYNGEQQGDPIRVDVLALGAGGQLLGVAAFDPHPFVYEQVGHYTERVVLFARTDVSYLASDGCLCAPGTSSIGLGNASTTGCNPEIPSSFARLVDTAGCELPPGASLPTATCDGQIYPGERPNRDLPCFATVQGACRAGHRICNDQGGRAYASECLPDASAAALPSGALCDAYLGCEKMACGDPGACLKASTPAHRVLRCTLPVSSTASDGASVACAGGSWSFAFGNNLSGASCVATMLDGLRQGPVTLGWQKSATAPDPQLSSSLCPPTLTVSRVDSDPSRLPSQLAFSFSIGDQIYDVTLSFQVGCGDPTELSLRCDAP